MSTATVRLQRLPGNSVAPQIIAPPKIDQEVEGFFKREYRRSLAGMWAKVGMGFAAMAAAAVWAYFIYKNGQAIWLEAFPAAVGLAGGLYLTFSLVAFLAFRRELASINITSSAKVVLPSLTKIYRKLATRAPNTNWFCAGLYVFGGLCILFTIISAWAINLSSTGVSDFGRLSLANGDNAPAYVVYVMTGLVCLGFIYHVTVHLVRQWRLSAIDTFYGFQLVPQAEIEVQRSAKNKRNRWIFISFLIVVFFAFWMVYKFFISRKKIPA